MMPTNLPTMAILAGMDADTPGDCWRCCVAGMLGLTRDEVPHFVAESGDAWFDDTRAFVEAHTADGTINAYEPTFPAFVSSDGSEPDPPYPLVILSGPSPRGDFLHAVLVDWRTGDLVWDPHPDRTGLAGPAVDMVLVTAKGGAA